MIKNLLITVVAAVVISEIIEHLILPVVWYLSKRKDKSVCGVEGMIGREVEIVDWHGREGKVLFNGERWQAAGDADLATGDKAVIVEVKGLVLKVQRKRLKTSQGGMV